MRNLPLTLLQLFLSAVIPVATVVLFVTLAIYSGNTREFATAYIDLAGKLLPYAALLVVGLFVAGLPLTRDGRARYQALLNALAILLWLQGNILVWKYGVLDGSTINWLEDAWRGALDTAVWIVLLLLAIYGYRKFGKGLFVAAVATFVIQGIASTQQFGEGAEVWQTTGLSNSAEDRAAALRFSQEFNIVHIVMDGFQSDIFASILADTDERDFKKELRGFTFFDKHMGPYPYTQLTLPAMLSGKLFRNDQPVNDFVDASIKGTTITNSAFAQGFEVDFAAPVPLKNVYTLGQHNNAYGITSSGHVTNSDIATMDAAKLMDLALFRVVPHFSKALVHRDELWVFQAKAQSRSYLHLQYFSDLAFLEELASGMSADRSAPVYKLIHVMLSHRPIVGNSRCEFDGRKTETRENVTIHAQCGLLRVFAVLQRMKDLGIYDDSLIVLMADHGAWVPAENFTATSDANALTAAMATPTLAIKPPGAMQDFQVSSAPSSIIDIPATIAALANIDADFPGQSVYSLQPGEPRQRYHLTYGYGINPKAEGFLFPMQEWIVTGDPYDAKSWQPGMRYHPGSNSN